MGGCIVKQLEQPELNKLRGQRVNLTFYSPQIISHHVIRNGRVSIITNKRIFTNPTLEFDYLLTKNEQPIEGTFTVHVSDASHFRHNVYKQVCCGFQRKKVKDTYVILSSIGDRYEITGPLHYV